jgi:hypothetical protein
MQSLCHVARAPRTPSAERRRGWPRFAPRKQRAKIDEDEELEIVVLPAQKSFWDTIFDDQEAVLESRLPPHLRALLRWARTFEGGRLSARLPFEIRVR